MRVSLGEETSAADVELSLQRWARVLGRRLVLIAILMKAGAWATIGLLVIRDGEAYCQPCLSPVWDTSLAGHALAFRRDPLGFLQAAAGQCGPIARLHAGPLVYHLVADPGLAAGAHQRPAA